MLPVGGEVTARAILTCAIAALLGACTDAGSCPYGPDLDEAACTTVAAMRGVEAPPPSPSNAHADDLDAAKLGFAIFFDARFSRDHNLRCEGCHAPEHDFDDLKPLAIGLATGPRNTPTALDAARRTRGFFWDGRADALWVPPILAMENPREMGSTRLEIAHAMADKYADRYAALFGPLPPLTDTVRFPAIGKPGDPAWDAMAPADQDAINRVAANVGKALEAYLRKLVSGPSPFDRFLDGDATALTAQQARGLAVFVHAGCASCHGGPLLADGKYHDLGVPLQDGADPDPGRAAAIAVERAQLFGPLGPYADAPVPIDIADATPADAGAIRTPTLRNLTLTGPYMHNGKFATIDEAVAFHLTAGGPGADPDLVAHPLGAADQAALVDFLGTLTGVKPPPPWNNWPDTP